MRIESRLIVAALVLGTAVFCIASQDPIPEEPTQKIELFNGRDLTNWYKFIQGRGKNCDPKGVFSVVDGKIRVTGEEFGCITTEKAYKNYKLTVEYRWSGGEYGNQIGKSPDSGILYHSIGDDGGCLGIWMRCLEYNVIKSRTGDLLIVENSENKKNSPFSCSGIVDSQGRWQSDPYAKKDAAIVHLKGSGRINNRYRPPKPQGGFKHETPEVYPEKKEGQWNTCVLICDGDKVEHIFNGITVVQACNVTPTGGRIQLQSEGHGIEFRRVTLEPLPKVMSQGLIADVVYEKPDCTPLVIGGWSKGENVQCSDYCVHADIWHTDGTVKWALRADFSQGTHDWEKALAVYVPKKPISRVRVNFLCRKGTGNAIFRDGFIERRVGEGEDPCRVPLRNVSPAF